MRFSALSRFARRPLEVHLGRILLFAFAITLAIASSAVAQSNPQSLGLKPPTQADLDWMDRNLKATDKVRLNELGLRRLNEYRAQRGLPRISTTTAPVGQESVGATQISVGGQTVGASTGVPGTIDNSTLDCFPPVRNQGTIGSCCSFATTYYVGTHMTGLVRGWNNKSDLDNTRKFSPKWTYNFVNDGGDNGSWYSSTMDALLKLGCATWSELPYDGAADLPLTYLSWHTGEAVWRNAINYRFSQAGRVQSVDTATGLTNMKALLNNGYLLLYATDIYGWQFTQFSNDPSTSLDDTLAGRKVCSVVKSNSSGHAMTIVGYSDNVWTDINKNGVVDTGEKGALKIVNSWGNNWGVPGFSNVTNDGFAWIAYDALKSVSAVAGADNSNRASGYRSAFWGSEVYWITARASYTPSLLGRFTISHARRADLSLRLGTSATSTQTPASYFPVTTTFGFQNSTGQPEIFKYLGGNYGLNGQAGSTTAATFVFDFTDLVQTGTRRYYLEVNDRAAGTAANVSSFQLVSTAGATLGSANAGTGIPLSADNITRRAYIDLSLGSAPVINSSTNASGTVGSTFSFTVTALNTPTSFGANGLPPGLSIDTATGQITGTPTQTGTSTASLSATNANGTGVGSLKIAINPAAVNPPVITSATTKTGTVGEALTYSITATNTPTSFGATNLPPGLVVDSDTGAISGTPTQAGVFEVILSATNTGGTGTRGLSVTIDPPPATAPVITSAGTASGASGSAFTYRITATNTPTSFAAENLPSGLTLDGLTGDITGSLPVARSYDITLSAANAGGTGYKTLTLTVTGDSSFGPANDSFANRIGITGQSDTVTGANIHATAQTGEPSHAGSAASKSVWWTWTAPVNGSVTIDTSGSTFDTRLAVYTGSAVNGLTATASSNNGPISFDAIANVSYQIAVDGSSGATGDITLNLNQTGSGSAPANDNFEAANPLTGSSSTVTAGNVDATDQVGEPAHADNPAECSVWWTWTAPSNGMVVLDTVGSNFDTVLAVYTGTALGTLSLVAEDDESGGNNTSKTTFPVTSGTIYRIAVDGWNGATGSIALRLAFASGSAPANDDFASSITLAGNSANASSSNANATAEENEPSHAGYLPAKSVWWNWTATGSGSVTLDTIGSNYDTTLAVYIGSGVDALTPVQSDDDSGGSRTSKVTFLVASGTTYRIAVDGYAGATGSVSLNLTFTPDLTGNDDFVNRAILGEETEHASNTSATAESGEPSHAGNTSEKSIWWKWTATKDGRVMITTFGSDFDTVLGVYKGTDVAALTPVAENDDGPSGRTSEVTFFAVAGTEYQIAVDGYQGASGQALLAVTEVEGSDLYFTDFESFTSGLDTIEGTDGWQADGAASSGATGIFQGFAGSGKGGWIGFNEASDDVLVWRPINYVPQSASKALVRFSVDVMIRDSSNGKYDYFDFNLYNTGAILLGGVTFNNTTQEIERYNGMGFVSTGVFFANSRKYRLTIDMNFATNRWTAYLDNTVIFANQPITSKSPIPQLSLGDLDIGLYRSATTSGDNHIVFDNYRLTVLSNEPAPPPTTPPTISTNRSRLSTRRTSISVKGTVTVPGSALARVRYRLNNGSWKGFALSGSGVVRTFDVKVKNVQLGRNIVIFEAIDVLGRTVSDRVRIDRN